MAGLLIIADGQKSINFELLEEKYGPELAESIRPTFELFVEREWDWDFKVLNENSYSVDFIMYTPSVCRFFEYSKILKKTETYVLGKWKMETVTNLMEKIVDSIEV